MFILLAVTSPNLSGSLFRKVTFNVVSFSTRCHWRPLLNIDSCNESPEWSTGSTRQKSYPKSQRGPYGHLLHWTSLIHFSFPYIVLHHTQYLEKLCFAKKKIRNEKNSTLSPRLGLDVTQFSSPVPTLPRKELANSENKLPKLSRIHPKN